MEKCTLPYCKQDCIHNPIKHIDWPWDKQGQILSGIKNAFGSVWYEGKWAYFYFADFKNIYLAKSRCGFEWQIEGIVLRGEPNSWDGGLDAALVFKDEGVWYLLYRGHDLRGKLPTYSIGLASSSDGINWSKHPQNPLLSPLNGSWEGEYSAKGQPTIFDPWGIIRANDVYYLWFNADNPNTCRSTGLATSLDLVHWYRREQNPIFKGGRFCVCPFKYKDYYYMVVTANGFQRRNNCFELYRCKTPDFYEQDREFLGTVLGNGGVGEFDEGYIDTPYIVTKDIYRDSFPDTKTGFLLYTGESSVIGQWSHGIATFSFEDLEKKTKGERNELRKEVNNRHGELRQGI